MITNLNITTFNVEEALRLACDTLRIEAEAILDVHKRFEHTEMVQSFTQAIRILLACRGRIVVSGVGKSGHIGRKLAATFASTGAPAFFVHPTEASHGDLGMVKHEDVLLVLSNSGETAELLSIVPLVKRIGGQLIALTGQPGSQLAQLADVHLDVSVKVEACPLNLAPTASTTAALAMGDALAVALLNARGFSAADFARSHPGGKLGRKLLTHVSDIMRTGAAVPRVTLNASVMDAIFEITAKRMGMTVVVSEQDNAAGVFTDGDLRRILERGLDLRQTVVSEVMTHRPYSIAADCLAVEAVELMERHRINQLIVTTIDGKLVGALTMHDLLLAQVV